MTTAGKVEWHGKELMQALRDGANDAMFEAGEILLESARRRVPVVTGNLKNSGYVSTKNKSSYVKRRGWKRERKPLEDGSVVIAFSAPHSHLVEFGTKRMAAKPYLRPALDELKDKIGKSITVSLSKSVAKKLAKAK